MNTIQTNLPFHKNTYVYQKDNKLMMAISLNLAKDKYITAKSCIEKLPRKEEFYVVKGKRFTVIFIEKPMIFLDTTDELKKKHAAMLNSLMILHRHIKIRHLQIEVEQLRFKFL